MPEIALYCTLCYLASRSYTDICLLVYPNLCSTVLYGRQCMPLSNAKTYELCGQIPKNWLVQSAVGFSSISTNHVMTECVAVLDGYHMEIATPPKKKSTMSSLTSLVTTRHMVSTYKLCVTTTVISCLLRWVGLV